MPDQQAKTALITGASSGIGREMARIHAATGGDLVIIARSADKLAEVAKAGYDAMLAGKLDVIAGMPFSQRIQLAFIPFSPKKMLLKQIRVMQEV